jgi:hypothetical protein
VCVFQRGGGGGCLPECSHMKQHSDIGGPTGEDAVILLFKLYTLYYNRVEYELAVNMHENSSNSQRNSNGTTD